MTDARKLSPKDLERAVMWGDRACVLAHIAALEAEIAQARSRALEEAAGVARSFLTVRQAMLEVEYEVNSKHGGDATVDEFAPIIAERIAAAILALKEKT